MKLRRLTDADSTELFQAITESLAHLRLWMPWAANGTPAIAEWCEPDTEVRPRPPRDVERLRRLGFTEIDRRAPPREPAIGNRVGVDVVWELRR
ncbi:hypothetical protein [Lentzea flaviverrucosa]|uniref:Uncharacterized protein n=1 Tax=Lentzea flaviverrucosa TaxID=200379 RepID=A0A1H9XVI4_9PSEU|nr:hypothetical protein [Lentzea flaviverrucosa]RDI18261.1 hypothetical protein DFR72_11955 [Lentzea flaviverrucosa]SES50198.1 hypothetical protein SAMN05216195_11955 [Lentzea flaviverrucosa]